MKVKTGDTFLIPLDGESNAIGQIVIEEKNFIYVAVYTMNDNLLYNMDDDLLEGLPLVLARTSKLFFKLGRWKVISNKAVKRDISYLYRCNTFKKFLAISYKRVV